MKDRIIILGAGISGLSLGWKLAYSGIQGGEFMYMDVDECMKKAFGLADRLLMKYRQGKSRLTVSGMALNG